MQTPFPVQLSGFVQLIFIVALLAFLIRRFAKPRACRHELFDFDRISGFDNGTGTTKMPEIRITFGDGCLRQMSPGL